MHPTITREMFSAFNCMEVDGVERLYNDLEVICYQNSHQKFISAVALPSIFIYSIGIPFVGFLAIFMNRDQLEMPLVR
jgi:hypothetical protein